MRTTMTEIFESYANRVVLCVGLLAAKALLGSLVFLFEDSAATLARAEGILEYALALSFLVIAISTAVGQARLLHSLSGPADLKRRGLVHEDGFIFHAYRTAALYSALLTGGTLAILQTVSTRIMLPGTFFVKLALFICCASFVVTYCIVIRAAGAEAAEAA
jgi:hypothetical protein